MFFNSPEFVAFFLFVLVAFAVANRKRTLPLRNLVLLLASYWFYAQLHAWFVALLVYTTLVNYLCGLWLARCQQQGRRGRAVVTVAILLSLAQLALFKYAYLAVPSVILPVGLSFFTFQALTYTIDIYRQKIPVERNLLNVALFVSFFPTLLSGPIERARNLLPQFRHESRLCWENLMAGAGLFVWGLFKKVVIADRLAEYVNMAYFAPGGQSGATLAIAAVFYSFQIYCDFSGYADMAIGCGRILGFNLMQNFNFPYYVNTIKEFWRRWHISLTSWFTEYVYISMGGNRVSHMRWLLNISTVFLLSGIWHGATWSFVILGALHAAFYLAERFWGPKRPGAVWHVLVFVAVTLAWVFFRAADCATAWLIVTRICTDLFSPINWGSSTFSTLLTTVLLIAFIIREYMLYKSPQARRPAVEYLVLFLCICLFGVSNDQFVYFQF